jgi:hypothetical protein
LIGQEAIWIPRQETNHYQFALIATALFLLLLAGVALWSWLARRGDAQARARVSGRRAAPRPEETGPSGLDELKLE